MTKSILGEHANYYVAKALLGLGDVFLEKKEYDFAEKYFHQA